MNACVPITQIMGENITFEVPLSTPEIIFSLPFRSNIIY